MQRNSVPLEHNWKVEELIGILMVENDVMQFVPIIATNFLHIYPGV
jgi:hypothetical protein